jgi:hypothetical protein
MAQFPFEQVGVPLLDGHTLPQEPQLRMSVFKSTSQPFKILLSQFANPVLHVMVQAEEVQDVKPLIPVGQTLPQVPQFWGSEAVSVSQPFARLPSQFE